MDNANLECPLCGRRMREVRGQQVTNHGIIERTWQCPECLHREVRHERRRARAE